MTSLAGAPEAIASAGASIWNRNGTGSSSYRKKKKNGDCAASAGRAGDGKDGPVV